MQPETLENWCNEAKLNSYEILIEFSKVYDETIVESNIDVSQDDLLFILGLEEFGKF
jgi:hypothetical protein